MEKKDTNKNNDKLVVIGWVDYDNDYFPAAPEKTNEMFDAVVEEVKEHGYLFGGDSHDNHSNCCPVLSNGYKMCFSWRGWGAVIGAAYRTGNKRKYEYMDGYMDMLINPKALRYPPGGVNCSLIKSPRIFHTLEIPASHDPWDYTVCFVCPNTPKMKQILPHEYLKLVHHLEDGSEYTKLVRVRRVITAKSVDEILDEVSAQYYPAESSLYGFEYGLTDEQLVQKFCEDFPREQFDEFGAVCFVYGELEAGDDRDMSLWIEKKTE